MLRRSRLAAIGKIVVLGQPAALDAVEAVDSLNRPMAACLPCFGGMQYGELTIRRSVQGTDP
jgi:hypothetical protein